MTTEVVMGIASRAYLEDGLKVEFDSDSGVIDIYDGKEWCLRGIQKGEGQPWIVTFRDTANAEWSWPDNKTN